MNVIQRLGEKDAILWSVAFIGVCVLVAMGKADQKFLEYLLFAVGGAIAAQKSESVTLPKV